MTTKNEWDEELKNDPEYCNAQQYSETFDPKEGESYDWVIEHAKYLFELESATWKDLDDKANSTAVSVGAITTGLVALLVAASATQLAWYVIATAMVPLTLAILSLWFASLVRQPRPGCTPPSVVQFSNLYDQKSGNRACTIPAWALAIAITRKSLKIKARYLNWSIAFWRLAALALLLPVIAAILGKLSHLGWL